jgi:RNA polymerase sigma-70 factor (ECF subfamily)
MRAVLLLRYYEGMSEAEMAEALEIPRGTVKSRLHAALRELRGAYGVSR